jgi:hypothetical protein
MAILNADSHFKGAFALVGAKESSDHIMLLPQDGISFCILHTKTKFSLQWHPETKHFCSSSNKLTLNI